MILLQSKSYAVSLFIVLEARSQEERRVKQGGNEKNNNEDWKQQSAV